MPEGIFIFSSDIQENIKIEAKYPEDLTISEKILNIINISHEIKEGYSFSAVSIGKSKFASLYLGPELNYTINLYLTEKENSTIFENALSYYSKDIMKDLSSDQFKELLPKIYEYISLYPTFDEEQKLAIAHNNEIKRLIMTKLIQNAFISKKDLLDWVKEKKQIKNIVLDPILDSLIELGLVRISGIKDVSDEYVYCTGDFFITRLPPSEIFEMIDKKKIPESIASKYLSKVKEFFQSYSPTTEDAKKIAELISDYDCYNILKLLRLSPATEKGLLSVGKKIKDLNMNLQKLQSSNVSDIIKDEKGGEYHFLISDIRIKKFFPEYLLKIILKKYNEKSVANSIILDDLELLQNTYDAEMKRIKEEEKKEEMAGEKEK